MDSMSTERASSSSLSSSFRPRWTHDVFLSFRGEDTRNNFTDHLFNALKQKGIFTFRDDEKLERGKSISLELSKAIEKSRFAIVIFSRNYASSTWCLDELVKIVGCMKEIRMTVLPAFYNVDPSNVREQKGAFAQAFVEHEERFKENIDKVQKWRDALTEVANISGCHLKDRLRHKKILLVLDDVNELVQLEKLVGEHDWFGPGSRVIITTRDEHLLVIHEINEIYEVEALNDDEALQLFSLKAFRKDHPTKYYVELSQDFVHYANGLPLAIEAIVRQECPQDPGKRSRLWLYKDIDSVLTKNTGTKEIQCIALEWVGPKKVDWNPEAFSKMQYLKLLQIHHVQLMHAPKHLPNSLRFLDWSGCPLKSLPSSFQSNELVELCMRNSNIERLWKGTKNFERLKFIHLDGSLKLIETPDFTAVPNLEKLVLEYCINLRGIHPSIGVHKKLILLDLGGCKNLKTLPSKFEMESLEILNLSRCSKIKTIPEFGRNMKRLCKLYLDGTAITKLPTSIEHLTGLISLNLRDYKNLVCLPSTIFNSKLLKDVDISGCSKLERLPENLGNAKSIEELYLDGSGITKLPTSIEHLTGLTSLNLRDCKSLVSLPSTIFNLKLLKYVYISGCSKLERLPENLGNAESVEVLDVSGTAIRHVPSSIGMLKKLKVLSFRGCKGSLSSNKSWYELFPFYSTLRVPMDLLSSSLSGLCSLSVLDLRDCNLKAIPNDIGCLFSLKDLFLIGNDFVCLPESIDQLSNLLRMWLDDCTSLQSLPNLPLNIWDMGARGCSSLHMLPDQLKVTKYLHFDDCFKLTANQDFTDMYLAMIKKYLQGLLSPQDVYDMNIVIPGSEILEGSSSNLKVKKCGIRMVYKKDIEDHNRITAQCNNNITPYEGMDVPHHNFDNSTVVVETNKAKRSRDEAGPSGQGSSNDVPHPKRIERLTEFMAQGNSDGEESSEFKECREELSDWQESSESDLEGGLIDRCQDAIERDGETGWEEGEKVQSLMP
uniref:TIR domain-containing protein n=1 Tax=Fagus sylvatica TaxID=28930 RepID=A0A2N9GNB1_FAGSY